MFSDENSSDLSPDEKVKQSSSQQLSNKEGVLAEQPPIQQDN